MNILKEFQLLIGLGLIALALYLGLANTHWTEFEACMKYSPQYESRGDDIEDKYKSVYCRAMVQGK